jgi:hypothetical protein
MPPRTIFEKQFFENNCLTEAYENERNYAAMSYLDHIEGEPLIRLNDFILLLGVIAVGYVPKCDSVVEKVQILFEDKLKLSSAEYGPGSDLEYRNEL